MSGRPAAPSYTVRTFAPDTNYPAGSESWSSNPTKVEPPGAASVGFVPGQGVAAQYTNRLFNDAFTQDTNAKSAISTVLEYVGQTQALNWPVKQAPGGASQLAAIYSPLGRWYVVSSADVVQASSNAGLTWSSPSGATNCYGGDSDASGNLVIPSNVANVLAYNAGTDAWSTPSVLGGHAYVAHVAFDPVSGYWVWQSVNGVGAMLCYRSTDRATWTAATTVASGWFASTDVADLKANKTSGRVLAAGKASATSVHVSYSDNGGDTWTAASAITTTIDATHIDLTHNADEGAWYLVIGELSAASEVWRSTDDGASWTKMSTQATGSLHRIAGFGALLISTASATSGSIAVYSLDSGATWEKVDLKVSGTPRGVFSGGGRPMIVTSDTVYMGIAMGKPSAGSFT